MIRATLPPDVVSILDVGCGVGLLTRSLAATHEVVGLDVSLDVHRGAAERRVCGLATALPFRSGSVDLVLSTQLVEHLQDDDLAAIARELVRVSRRYVLITTTYRENLEEATVRCPACGRLFNAYGHLRTFDEPSLARLVPGWKLRVVTTFAPARAYPRSLSKFNQNVLGFWHYELALLCTHCGNDRFPRSQRGLARLARVSNLVARLLPRPRRPTRIVALFEKSSHSGPL